MYFPALQQICLQVFEEAQSYRSPGLQIDLKFRKEICNLIF